MNPNNQKILQSEVPTPVAREVTPPVLPAEFGQTKPPETPAPETTISPETPKAGESEQEKETAEEAAAVAPPPVDSEPIAEPSKKPDEKPVTPPANSAEFSVKDKVSVLQDEVGAIVPPEK